MKKRFLAVVCAAVFFICLGLMACNPEKVVDNVRLSELRDDILTGGNDQYKVVVVTGVRETPFSIDGISQKEKVQFTIITLTPEDYISTAEYTFNVTVGGTGYSGKMVKHPFNQTFSAEIDATTKSAELDITIAHSGGNTSIKAVSVKNDNFIDGEKAYSIASQKLKKGISAKEGKEYEIFVRLIENPINSAGGYFWYVAFVFDDKTTLAVLIEPVTMEIVAVKD